MCTAGIKAGTVYLLALVRTHFFLYPSKWQMLGSQTVEFKHHTLGKLAVFAKYRST